MTHSLPSLLKDIQRFCKRNRVPSRLHCLVHSSKKRRQRRTMITKAHVIYVLLLYQYSGYRCFKWFHDHEISRRPGPIRWPGYSWFLRLKKSVIQELLAYLQSKPSEKTGLYYIVSSALTVCHNKRIPQHKTFEGQAERGKTSTGWFYGFKVHLIINHLGQIMDLCLTKGNVDDRVGLDKMGKRLQGVICGDKGYISAKREKILEKRGLRLLTRKRKNMKRVPLSEQEENILRQRGLIEVVFGYWRVFT